MAGVRGKGRKTWNALMAREGVQPKLLRGKSATKRKRSSGRVRNLSRFVKHVDKDTREQIREAQLNALEANNHVEMEAQDDDSDEWMSDNEERKSRDKRKPKRGQAGRRKKKKEPVGRTLEAAARLHAKRTLAQVLLTSGEAQRPGVTYFSAQAPPSAFPPRRLCSICGFAASYTCTRCRSMYCCTACKTIHQEERCLKFL